MLLNDPANKENFRRLNEVLDSYGRDPEQLIRVLQKAQDIFGYLPEEVQAYISDKMDIPVSAVHGVVTFYSLFSTEPRGKYNVNVCLGTACYVQGAQQIYDSFKDQLGLTDNDTTEDKLFTVRSSRCIGACGLAPVITINEDVHGKLTARDVSKLINRYKKDKAAGEKDEDKHPKGHGTYQEETPTRT